MNVLSAVKRQIKSGPGAGAKVSSGSSRSLRYLYVHVFQSMQSVLIKSYLQQLKQSWAQLSCHHSGLRVLECTWVFFEKLNEVEFRIFFCWSYRYCIHQQIRKDNHSALLKLYKGKQFWFIPVCSKHWVGWNKWYNYCDGCEKKSSKDWACVEASSCPFPLSCFFFFQPCVLLH